MILENLNSIAFHGHPRLFSRFHQFKGEGLAALTLVSTGGRAVAAVQADEHFHPCHAEATGRGVAVAGGNLPFN